MPQGFNYTSAAKALPQSLGSTAPVNPMGNRGATSSNTNRQYQTASSNQMLFSDRGVVGKRNVESQGTLGLKDNLGGADGGFSTKASV